MNTISVKACEQCGSPIMLPATRPLDPTKRLPPSNECSECGHTTPPQSAERFQCSPLLLAVIEQILSEGELKALRRNPKQFASTLNNKLHTAGKPAVVLDENTDPITIYRETTGD